MNDQLLWIVMTAGEVLLVVVLVLLVAWLRNQAIRRRDRKAIRSLVSQIRELKAQRRDEIAAFLGEHHGLSGETLERAVHDVYQAELQLIQGFANTYLKRDATTAASFHRAVEHGVSPYWQLPVLGVAQDGAGAELAPSAAAGEEAEGSDSLEMDKLRSENVRLSEELRVTMDTMSRMLNEYSNIFSKESELQGITVIDEDGEEGGEAPEAGTDDATATDAATLDQAGDDGTTGETAIAEESASGANEQEDALVDPDELLAATQDAMAAEQTDDVQPPSAEDDRSVELDSQLKDLSADEQEEQADLPADGEGDEAEAAERQRIIDADS